MPPFTGIIAAFAFSIIAFYYGMRLARRVGYVDRPGGRKQHVGGTPPIGGLVIMPVFAFFYYHSVPDAMNDWPLFAGLGALLALGIADDRFAINAWAKFIGQIFIATFVVVYGDAEIVSLGDLFGNGPVFLGWFSVPFTVASLVLLMNALNMIDGLDGLAGGIAASVLVMLMLACALAGLNGPMIAMAMLLAPLLAFLVFNIRHPWRKKAAIFLGDAGSLTLGLAIGWFAIRLSQGVHTPVLPITVIWLMAVPVIDTLTLFVLRLTKGRHPFSADRNHLHHRFLARDVPVHWTVLLMILATLGAGAIGMAGMQSGISEIALLLLWLGCLIGYIGFSLRPSAERDFDYKE
jgi:UDP-GlcNAc:undecaprenyl-phosphate GlcNAc-1-phosphate transferase